MTVLALVLASLLAAPSRAAIDPRALPLGDGKYGTTPVAGSLFACDPAAMYHVTATGRSPTGWWVHGSTWDSTEKPQMSGRVSWAIARVSIATQGDKRVIATNDLPVGELTGVYPADPADPVYSLDKDPNVLRAQSISVSLPSAPQVAAQPGCVGLYVAIGLDGTLYQSALDSQGRDEPAHEMQDLCGGMSSPWPDGMYHRFRPSDCIPHVNEPAALIGYALDGFGLYGPYDENGVELTTADLDECHGRTSPVMWDGRLVTMYHYVLTRDYPYSVSCFRGGTAAAIPTSPPPKMLGGLAPPTDSASPVGAVSGVDSETITGWACDGDSATIALTTFVYVDGPREGQGATAGIYLGVASASRQVSASVAAACGGSLAHGFSFPVPESLRDGRSHAVYAYAADVDSGGFASGSYTLLSGSPATFSSPTSILDVGLRLRDGAQTVPIAAQTAGASPLKARGAGSGHDVMLVDPADVNATRVIVNTRLGVKALRRL